MDENGRLRVVHNNMIVRNHGQECPMCNTADTFLEHEPIHERS